MRAQSTDILEEQKDKPQKNPYESNIEDSGYKHRYANSGLLLPLPDNLKEYKVRKNRSQSKSISELLGDLKHLSPKAAKQRLS